MNTCDQWAEITTPYGQIRITCQGPPEHDCSRPLRVANDLVKLYGGGTIMLGPFTWSLP